MKETKTKKELESLCTEIVNNHQEKFEEILNSNDSEYECFLKYTNLKSELRTKLEVAVNNFNPKVENDLQLIYLRLLQYNRLDDYLAFTRRNTPRFFEKFENLILNQEDS